MVDPGLWRWLDWPFFSFRNFIDGLPLGWLNHIRRFSNRIIDDWLIVADWLIIADWLPFKIISRVCKRACKLVVFDSSLQASERVCYSLRSAKSLEVSCSRIPIFSLPLLSITWSFERIHWDFRVLFNFISWISISNCTNQVIPLFDILTHDWTWSEKKD